MSKKEQPAPPILEPTWTGEGEGPWTKARAYFLSDRQIPVHVKRLDLVAKVLDEALVATKVVPAGDHALEVPDHRIRLDAAHMTTVLYDALPPKIVQVTGEIKSITGIDPSSMRFLLDQLSVHITAKRKP
jgi:hypothetical protein